MTEFLNCPDCASDALFEMIEPRIYKLTIAHDDTCPWFAQHERERECQ